MSDKAKLMQLKKDIHGLAGHTFKAFMNFHLGNNVRASTYADLAKELHADVAKQIDELIEEAK